MALLFFAATTALECATHDDCAVNQYCDDTAHEAPCAASGKVGVFNVSAGVLQPSEGLHFTYQRTETSVESTIRSLNDSAFNISGNVRVVGTAQSDAWSVHYDLSIEPASGGAGALAACAAGSCGLRIHSGDSCADAGNHWYPSAMADPWSTTTYAAQMRGSFIVDLGGAAGFTWSDLVGRVVIVDSASGGEHAACGIIGAQEFTTVEFVLEKPEEIAPQLHAQTSALLGWLHSGISGSFTVDVHNPGNIQSGALSAGNPNCPITNGAPVYPDAMKCTRCPTGAKQFWYPNKVEYYPCKAVVYAGFEVYWSWSLNEEQVLYMAVRGATNSSAALVDSGVGIGRPASGAMVVGAALPPGAGSSMPCDAADGVDCGLLCANSGHCIPCASFEGCNVFDGEVPRLRCADTAFTNVSCPSITYPRAEETFIDKCAAVGGVLDDDPQYTHAGLVGVNGEALRSHVCTLGDCGMASTVLYAISGVHGAEMFAPTMAQLMFMDAIGADALDIAAGADTCAVFLFANEPWGASYGQKENEDNIDILKNANEQFNWLDPNGWVHRVEPFENFVDGIDSAMLLSKAGPNPSPELIASLFSDFHGLGFWVFAQTYSTGWGELLPSKAAAFTQALFFGQGTRPLGDSYWGEAASFSKQVQDLVATKYLRGKERILLLDLHSAAGPFGQWFAAPSDPSSHETVQGCTSTADRTRDLHEPQPCVPVPRRLSPLGLKVPLSPPGFDEQGADLILEPLEKAGISDEPWYFYSYIREIAPGATVAAFTMEAGTYDQDDFTLAIVLNRACKFFSRELMGSPPDPSKWGKYAFKTDLDGYVQPAPSASDPSFAGSLALEQAGVDLANADDAGLGPLCLAVNTYVRQYFYPPVASRTLPLLLGIGPTLAALSGGSSTTQAEFDYYGRTIFHDFARWRGPILEGVRGWKAQQSIVARLTPTHGRNLTQRFSGFFEATNTGMGLYNVSYSLTRHGYTLPWSCAPSSCAFRIHSGADCDSIGGILYAPPNARYSPSGTGSFELNVSGALSGLVVVTGPEEFSADAPVACGLLGAAETTALLPPSATPAERFFSATFAEADAKFRAACILAGGRLRTYERGVDAAGAEVLGWGGESLRARSCSVGDPTLADALLMISGTDGASLFSGAAAQLQLLDGIAAGTRPLPANTWALLLHALNPWGASFGVGVDEQNHDVSKNAHGGMYVKPLENALAERLIDVLGIPHFDLDVVKAGSAIQYAAVDAEAEGDGASLVAALQLGQQRRQYGPAFVGTAPSWSRSVLYKVARLLRTCSRVFVVDLAAAGSGTYGGVAVEAWGDPSLSDDDPSFAFASRLSEAAGAPPTLRPAAPSRGSDFFGYVNDAAPAAAAVKLTWRVGTLPSASPPFVDMFDSHSLAALQCRWWGGDPRAYDGVTADDFCSQVYAETRQRYYPDGDASWKDVALQSSSALTDALFSSMPLAPPPPPAGAALSRDCSPGVGVGATVGIAFGCAAVAALGTWTALIVLAARREQRAGSEAKAYLTVEGKDQKPVPAAVSKSKSIEITEQQAI